MTARPAGHALVEALIAQGVHTAFGVPGESYLAVLDGFHEHRDRIRFIACRQEGGAAFMAEAQGKLTRPAGHLLRHARARRHQRQHRAAHGVPGLDADDPVRRPGGQRPARPRGLPGGRLPPDVRPRHAGHGQVGGRGAGRRPPARVRGARLPHRAAGPAGPGGAGAARGHADHADRGAGAAARRAGAGLAGARRAARPARDADGGAAAAAHRRRQRLGRRGAPARCSASPRTGSCRSAAASASRTPSTTATRCMPATWASASTRSWRRACARPT